MRKSCIAVVALLAAVLAGCTSSGGPNLAAHPPRRSQHSTASTTTTTPLEAYVTAFGATTAVWDANHTMDPQQNGFWPRLDNGYDTYSNVQVSDGRVVGYVENFDPPTTSSLARFSVMSELPTDAKVVVDSPSSACEQLVLTSPTLQAILHSDVLAQLRSDGSYDPNQVTSITYSRIAVARPTSASLPSC